MQSSGNLSQTCGSCPGIKPCPSRPAAYIPPSERQNNKKQNRKR